MATDHKPGNSLSQWRPLCGPKVSCSVSRKKKMNEDRSIDPVLKQGLGCQDVDGGGS